MNQDNSDFEEIRECLTIRIRWLNGANESFNKVIMR